MVEAARDVGASPTCQNPTMAKQTTTATDEKATTIDDPRDVIHGLALESATVSAWPHATTWEQYQAVVDTTRSSIEHAAEGDR
mgnify:CR=1 FL=1